MGCAGAIRSGAQWVGVTSFNEWHEGTQIEPAADGARDTVQSFHYEHYQVPPASCPLPPSVYVRGCVQVCLAPSWLSSWLRIIMCLAAKLAGLLAVLFSYLRSCWQSGPEIYLSATRKWVANFDSAGVSG